MCPPPNGFDRGNVKDYVYVGTSMTASHIASGLPAGANCYFKIRVVCKGGGLTFVSTYGAAANAVA